MFYLPEGVDPPSAGTQMVCPNEREILENPHTAEIEDFFFLKRLSGWPNLQSVFLVFINSPQN